MGKYLIEKEQVVKNFKSTINGKEDFLQQIYLLGIVAGMNEANKDFNSTKKETLNVLSELKQEDYFELYKYGIKNIERLRHC